MFDGIRLTRSGIIIFRSLKLINMPSKNVYYQQPNHGFLCVVQQVPGFRWGEKSIRSLFVWFLKERSNKKIKNKQKKEPCNCSINSLLNQHLGLFLSTRQP